MALLEVEAMHYYYGNIHAIKGISLHVNEGEIVTVIGANGAGKSTMLRSVSGLLEAKGLHGNILFNGIYSHN
jgi:branched-chain amino acid transport system ATP-binding protein